MIVCYSFIWSVGLSYYDSPTEPRLTYHKFLYNIANADEIHALGQIRHINLLGFSIEVAREDGLAHKVGDAVGLGR